MVVEASLPRDSQILLSPGGLRSTCLSSAGFEADHSREHPSKIQRVTPTLLESRPNRTTRFFGNNCFARGDFGTGMHTQVYNRGYFIHTGLSYGVSHGRCSQVANCASFMKNWGTWSVYFFSSLPDGHVVFVI